MKKNATHKNTVSGYNGDVRGTAYVTEAAKPFKGNGVSSTAVVGGDLRAKGGRGSKV